MDNGIWLWEDEPIDVTFDASGYAFYKGGEGTLGLPQEAYVRLIAVKEEERILVEDIEGMRALVHIATSPEALEYVRLFTSLETHYLFPSISYVEPRRASGEPGLGEYTSEYERQVGLKPPESSAEGELFIIERNLLMSTQRLVRATEYVESDGAYTLHDSTTIDERAPIQYPAYE